MRGANLFSNSMSYYSAHNTWDKDGPSIKFPYSGLSPSSDRMIPPRVDEHYVVGRYQYSTVDYSPVSQPHSWSEENEDANLQHDALDSLRREVTQGEADSIAKRRRTPTSSQRRAANIRERRRMFNLNEAFDLLRRRVPTFTYEKRLSRIETLRLAIGYISFMTKILNGISPDEIHLNVPRKYASIV